MVTAVQYIYCNLSLLFSDCLLKRDCRLLFELGPLHRFFSCAVLYTRTNWDNVQKLALVGFVWYQLMESGKGKELWMQESYCVCVTAVVTEFFVDTYSIQKWSYFNKTITLSFFQVRRRLVLYSSLNICRFMLMGKQILNVNSQAWVYFILGKRWWFQCVHRAE